MSKIKASLPDNFDITDSRDSFDEFSELEKQELEQWLDFLNERISRTEQTFSRTQSPLENWEHQSEG